MDSVNNVGYNVRNVTLMEIALNVWMDMKAHSALKNAIIKYKHGIIINALVKVSR